MGGRHSGRCFLDCSSCTGKVELTAAVQGTISQNCSQPLRSHMDLHIVLCWAAMTPAEALQLLLLPAASLNKTAACSSNKIIIAKCACCVWHFEAQNICTNAMNMRLLLQITADIDRWSNITTNATWCAGGTGHSDPSKCLCNNWNGIWCLLSAHFCHFGAMDPVPAGHAVPGAQEAQGSLAARSTSRHRHGTTSLSKYY